MAVLWVVAPCNLNKFTEVSEVLAASIIRAMRTSEKSVNFYQTIRRNNPEDGHLKKIVLYNELKRHYRFS
jgi:hypothetical protein